MKYQNTLFTKVDTKRISHWQGEFKVLKDQTLQVFMLFQPNVFVCHHINKHYTNTVANT